MKDRNQTELIDTISEERFVVYDVDKTKFNTFRDSDNYESQVASCLAEKSVVNTFEDGSFLYTFRDGTMKLGRVQKVYETVD